MEQHYLRWVSQLNSIGLTLAHAFVRGISTKAGEDVAEQLEALAKNIRERTKQEYR